MVFRQHFSWGWDLEINTEPPSFLFSFPIDMANILGILPFLDRSAPHSAWFKTFEVEGHGRHGNADPGGIAEWRRCQFGSDTRHDDRTVEGGSEGVQCSKARLRMK